MKCFNISPHLNDYIWVQYKTISFNTLFVHVFHAISNTIIGKSISLGEFKRLLSKKWRSLPAHQTFEHSFKCILHKQHMQGKFNTEQYSLCNVLCIVMRFEPEVNMHWGARGLLKWVFSRCWDDSMRGGCVWRHGLSVLGQWTSTTAAAWR